MNNKKPYSVLFVCTGNICRSPTAEALFRQRIREAGAADRFIHDSAGVASHHVGHPPDERSQKVLKAKGIDMSDLRARDVRPMDFYDFDLILAMDRSHYKALKRMAPKNSPAEIALYLPFAHESGEDEVPDPYYHGEQQFFDVLSMLDVATAKLLDRLSRS